MITFLQIVYEDGGATYSLWAPLESYYSNRTVDNFNIGELTRYFGPRNGEGNREKMNRVIEEFARLAESNGMSAASASVVRYAELYYTDDLGGRHHEYYQITDWKSLKVPGRTMDEMNQQHKSGIAAGEYLDFNTVTGQAILDYLSKHS